MKVEVLTPKGIEFEQDAQEIVLPTKTGQISVLPHHVPLISVLKAGTMKIVAGRETVEKEIEGGIIEVSRNRVSILLKKF